VLIQAGANVNIANKVGHPARVPPEGAETF
jgi:hypothetical protein